MVVLTTFCELFFESLQALFKPLLAQAHGHIAAGAFGHAPDDIRAARAAESVVLCMREGRLYCQSKEPLTIDERPADQNTPLKLESIIKTGQISMVLTRL